MAYDACMKNTDIERIIANMGDAGCNSEDIARVHHLHEAGLDDEIIKCGEKILENSTDNHLRAGAIQMLCFAYSSKGNRDKAKEYAGMADTYYVTSNELMVSVLMGDDAVKCCQSNIQMLLQNLLF